MSDWELEVNYATYLACRNSEFLIIDLRGNTGGAVHKLEWLIKHLYPNTNENNMTKLAFRLPTNHSLIQEAIRTAAQSTKLGYTIVRRGFHPEIYDSWEANQSLSDNWFESTDLIAVVGHSQQELTQLVKLPDNPFRTAPAISCPGKFDKTKLILLTDGANCSAGFFFPYLMQNKATIATISGLYQSEMSYGSCRGGSSTIPANPRNSKTFYHEVSQQEEQFPLLPIYRDLNFSFEELGFYANDLNNLIVNLTPLDLQADIRLPLWGDILDDDDNNRVYRSVLKMLMNAENQSDNS